MKDFAVKINNLGKTYNNKKPSFLSSFLGNLGFSHLKKNQDSYEFKALHNINVEIGMSESVGLIGRNGAGKSTLLKLISEISRPTCGEILIQGKIASVLDVGVGFHPDLSGRENIYHTGILLGMKKKEIDAKIQNIIAYSEIEKSIDLPVKQYSSGMYVRLAFSIAIHIEAEILIFDEVLTVGDASFRFKAIETIREYIRKKKSTVIIVSHNLSEIADLCDKTIWLEKGEVMKFGRTAEVISAYIENIFNPDTDTKINYIISNEKIRLNAVTITAKNKTLTEPFDTEDDLFITINFDKLLNGDKTDVGFTLTDNIGNKVFFSTSAFAKQSSSAFDKGTYAAVSKIPGRFLNVGTFMINIMFIENETEIIIRLTNAAVFRIDLHADDPTIKWKKILPGPLKPDLEWSMTQKN